MYLGQPRGGPHGDRVFDPKSLATRPGHVKNRDQLMDAAYGDSVYVDDRTIDSHIKRIRRKFRVVDSAFNEIETLYGIGYRYRESAAEAG